MQGVVAPCGQLARPALPDLVVGQSLPLALAQLAERLERAQRSVRATGGMDDLGGLGSPPERRVPDGQGRSVRHGQRGHPAGGCQAGTHGCGLALAQL